ncbi:MAG TPA: zf-HC2 domain-containing protein [Candidatus Angelobacter sp.]|nr:zf-HC2 domain-containing protein [Candidatus Angelobacter sp.]
MSCEWQDKIGLFVDDELQAADQQQVSAHLAECAECTASVAELLALKKAVQVGAKRYAAPPDLHAAVYRQLHPHARVSFWWKWGMSAVCMLLVVALGYALWPRSSGKDPLLAELVDQHVIALSSPNPVDVISQDRHTVKPWFQGKLPFTFNLPELAGSNYKLIGGKAVYLQQKPGAELLYLIGQHKISLFVLQLPANRASGAQSTFNIKSWDENGLRFYLVTDASDAESDQLIQMFQDANRS